MVQLIAEPWQHGSNTVLACQDLAGHPGRQAGTAGGTQRLARSATWAFSRAEPNRRSSAAGGRVDSLGRLFDETAMKSGSF
jgi:hypothetical protein